MKLAFIGHGNVGGALAAALARRGHEVTLAVRDPDAEPPRLPGDPSVAVASTTDAVAGAELVVLATPFAAVAQVVPPLAAALAGKVVIDCTNPVGPGLSHGLGSQQSGSAMIQGLAPAARVVKAFSIYGYENLAEPSFPGAGAAPAMMFCGDDAAAKAMVAALIAALGWEPVDVGGLSQALHLEHLTLLWIRMVRAGGASPHTVWARLRR